MTDAMQPFSDMENMLLQQSTARLQEIHRLTEQLAARDAEIVRLRADVATMRFREEHAECDRCGNISFVITAITPQERPK